MDPANSQIAELFLTSFTVNWWHPYRLSTRTAYASWRTCSTRNFNPDDLGNESVAKER